MLYLINIQVKFTKIQFEKRYGFEVKKFRNYLSRSRQRYYIGLQTVVPVIMPESQFQGI